jgi:hypothetical protein
MIAQGKWERHAAARHAPSLPRTGAVPAPAPKPAPIPAPRRPRPGAVTAAAPLPTPAARRPALSP